MHHGITEDRGEERDGAGRSPASMSGHEIPSETGDYELLEELEHAAMSGRWLRRLRGLLGAARGEDEGRETGAHNKFPIHRGLIIGRSGVCFWRADLLE